MAISETVRIPFFRVQAANGKSAPFIHDLSFGPLGNQILQAIASSLPSSNDPKSLLTSIDRMVRTEQVMSVKSGREWTDAITPTNSAHFVPLSEKLVDAICAENFKGFEVAPITISNAPRKLPRPLPCYYQLIAQGHLNFEYHYYERVNGAYVFKFSTLDPENDDRLKSFFMPDGFIPHLRLIPIQSSWDGGDFIPSSGNSNSFYCSRRFLDLARDRKWSNLCFAPIDAISHPFFDFRDLPWPPENWYPENHPPSAFSDNPSP